MAVKTKLLCLITRHQSLKEKNSRIGSPRCCAKNINHPFSSPCAELGRCLGREKFDWQEAGKFDCRLVRRVVLAEEEN